MFNSEKYRIHPESKISTLIMDNPYLILLLEHFGMKMPFLEKTVDELCLENTISTKLFLNIANLYCGVDVNYSASYTDIITVIDYLRNSHKYYLEEIYPNIALVIKQMREANAHREMAMVEQFFNEYFSEVRDHLDYENNIVFPYMIGLYKKNVENRPIKKVEKYSVVEYKDHHNDIEEKLNDLKNLLIKYLPQENDQPARRKLLFNLTELEYDLTIHSQIEDFILIPLVSELELNLNRQD